MSAGQVPAAAQAPSWERVGKALDRVGVRYTTSGLHIQAHCPAHDDGNASLSMDYRPEWAKPQTALHCHSGCDSADVAAALGLTLSDLYDAPPTKPATSTRTTRTKPKPTPKPVKATTPGPVCSGTFAAHRLREVVGYDYTDAEGTVIGTKVRKQCQREGCTAKNFLWRGLAKGSPVPLYNLPAIAEAIATGAPVYLTEGEKDADAITGAGGYAVTMGAAATGTGGSFKPWHAESLTGAHVIICADPDPTGHASAALIAGQLDGRAASVRIVQAATGKDPHDHLTAGLPLAGLVDITATITTEKLEDGAAEQRKSAEGEPADNVVPIRRSKASDDDDASPGRRIPMSIGQWCYATGAGQWPRGVYFRQGRDAWLHVAPLPYVRARIVRRSPNGTPSAMDYLIAATNDGPAIITSTLKLKDGSWANELGLPLSYDDKIVKAAGTAILALADRDAEIREAIPRADGGQITVPVPESLPDGYLRTSPATGKDATKALAAIIREVHDTPTAALVMGASAIAPYLKPLGRQSHLIHLHSPEGGTGKSTTARLAAGLWGDPFARGSGVLRSWNASQTGIGRHLGQLGILPVFLDESGMARWEPGSWGQVLFELTEGNDRLLAETKGPGTRIGAPWGGLLLSTGNARVTAAVSATRFGGVFRRVIEIAQPFTRDAEQAEHLDELMHTAWGHPGRTILATYTTDDVAARIADAETRIGLPTTGAARTIARHVASHVAGAAILDQIAGTGTTLTQTALTAAREILDRWTAPPSLADRLIAAVRDSIANHPAAWPTKAQYAAMGSAREDVDTPIPMHGIERQMIGVRADDDSWIAVFPGPWSEICADHELDSGDTLTELHTAGVLSITASAAAAHKWQTTARLGTTTAKVYKLVLPELDDDANEPAPRTAPDTPADLLDDTTPAEDTTGTPSSATTEQSSVTLVSDSAAEACPGCGEYVAENARNLYERYHVGCAPEPTAPAATTTHAESSTTANPTRGGERGSMSRAGIKAHAWSAARQRVRTGEPPQVLDILTGACAPLKTYADGRRRQPFWRPTLPGITDATRIINSYMWTRPYSGPVAVLDRTGAWLSAATTVEIAHDTLTHTGPQTIEAGTKPAPGYYQVRILPWTDDRLPSPLGALDDPAIWVAAPTVELLADLAAADRWGSGSLEVLDSYTGARARLNSGGWADGVRDLRAWAITEYGRDSDQYEAVKLSYSQAVALMIGTPNPGQGRTWKSKVQRPDWAHAIQAHSAATLWRRADDCLRLAPDLGPVSLRSVDELVIPADALNLITRPGGTGKTKPIPIDTNGIRLGTFKVKTSQEWTS